MALEQLFRQHEFANGLSDQQISSIAAIAHEVRFGENEVILVDGQHSTAFYLVISGSVVVELCTARYVVSVQALGAGQVFGWSSLLDRQDTLFQVRAREDTLALRLDGEALKALCRADPSLGIEILQRTLNVVAGRVKATELRFAEMCGIRV
jgi:CRP/FNR family transcriptional regulator, cyclic AMP receptor protein